MTCLLIFPRKTGFAIREIPDEADVIVRRDFRVLIPTRHLRIAQFYFLTSLAIARPRGRVSFT
jgi:hypothetical protein